MLTLRQRLNHQSWLENLPVFTAFSIAAAIIWFADIHRGSIALFLGVIAGVLADLDHHASGRVKQLFVILPAFTAVSLAVQFSIGNSILLTFIMTSVAFCATMAGAIDVRYRTIAFATLVVALYTTLPYESQLAWYLNPMMLIFGTIIYHSSRVAFEALFPCRPVQRGLADAFRALASYVAAKAPFFLPDERSVLEHNQYQLALRANKVNTSFNTCRDRLFYRLSGQHISHRTRRQLHDYFIAQDIHERISAAHVDYEKLLTALQHNDILFRLERMIRLQSKACTAYANALEQEDHYHYPPALARCEKGLHHAWQFYCRHHAQRPNQRLETLIANLCTINAKLAQLGSIPDSTQSEDSRVINSNAANLREGLQRLRDNLNLQSVYFRHALRISFLTLISCFIVESFHLHFGYWIMVTCVFICQPNYVATESKLLLRIIGTLAGVVVGSFLPLIAPDRISLLTLIVLCNTAFFYVRTRNYGVSTFFITVQVFIGFAMSGIDMHVVVVNRIFDTLVGTTISWVAVFYLWPDWDYFSLPAMTSAVLRSDAQYLRLILSQVGKNRDDIRYRAARRRVHESAAALPVLLNDMLAKPQKYQQHIEKTRLLLTQNYRIIGYISVLAVFRGTLCIRAETQQYMNEIGEQVAQLLDDLAQNRPINDALIALKKRVETDYNDPEIEPFTYAIARILKQLSAINQLIYPNESTTMGAEQCSGTNCDNTALSAVQKH